MKKFGIWAAFASGLYVLQSSLMPLISVHGVSADLLLLLSVSFGFIKGPRLGVLMGFCLGLMQDLATGTFFGVNTFTKMSVGFICGKFSDQVFREQLFLPLMASIFATVLNYFLPAMFMRLMGYDFSVMAHMEYTLLPMFVYQFVCAYPVHRFTCRVDEYVKTKK